MNRTKTTIDILQWMEENTQDFSHWVAERTIGNPGMLS